MSMAIEGGDIQVALRLATEQMAQDVETAKKGLESNFNDMAQKAATAATVAGAAITGALTAAVWQFANYGDTVDKAAQQIGFSADETSRLMFALEQSGTDIGIMKRAMDNMGKALEGGSEGLQALGLNLNNLKAMSPEEQFLTMARSIAGVENETQRMALAQEVFGDRVGRSLIPFLNAGAEGIDALRARHDELMPSMADNAKMAADFQDAMNEVRWALKGLAIVVAEELMPPLIKLVEKAVDWIVRFREWKQENEALAGILIKVAGVLGPVLMAAKPLMAILPTIAGGVKLAGAAFLAFTNPVGLAVLAIGGLVLAGWYVYNNWDEIKGKLLTIWTAIKKAGEIAWEGLKDIISGAVETMGRVVGTGMRSLVRIFTDPVGLIKDVWGELVQFFRLIWAAVGAVFITAWEIIKPIVDALKSAVNFVGSAFGKGIASGLEGTDNAVTALAGGGTIARAGWALVGEEGPELVHLPARSTVYDSQQSAGALGGGMGGGATEIVINNHFGRDSVRSEQDIDEIERRLADRIRRDLRGAGVNLA